MVNVSNMSRVYSEVFAFLEAIGEEYTAKIPTKLYTTIKVNRDFSYSPIYNKNQTMTKDMISKEALALIAGLNLEYWCENEIEKNKLKECYINNLKEENRQHSYENLFKKPDVQVSEETALIKHEEKSIFRKMLNKIKYWLKI